MPVATRSGGDAITFVGVSLVVDPVAVTQLSCSTADPVDSRYQPESRQSG